VPRRVVGPVEAAAYPLKTGLGYAGRKAGEAVDLLTGSEKGAKIGQVLGETAGEVGTFFLPGLPRLAKRIAKSDWFREITIPERSLMVQTVETMKGNGFPEAQILRTLKDPVARSQAFEEALSKKQPKGGTAPEASATPDLTPPPGPNLLGSPRIDDLPLSKGNVPPQIPIRDLNRAATAGGPPEGPVKSGISPSETGLEFPGTFSGEKPPGVDWPTDSELEAAIPPATLEWSPGLKVQNPSWRSLPEEKNTDVILNLQDRPWKSKAQAEKALVKKKLDPEQYQVDVYGQEGGKDVFAIKKRPAAEKPGIMVEQTDWTAPETGINKFKPGDVVGRISEQAAAEINSFGFNTQASNTVIEQKGIDYINASHGKQLSDSDLLEIKSTIEAPSEILPNIGTEKAPYRDQSVLMVKENGKRYVSIVEITPGEGNNTLWNYWKMDKRKADNYLSKFREEKARLLQPGGRPLPHIPPRSMETGGKPEGLSGSQAEASSFNKNITQLFPEVNKITGKRGWFTEPQQEYGLGLPDKALLGKSKTDRTATSEKNADWWDGKKHGDIEAARRFAEKYWPERKNEAVKEIIGDPGSAVLISVPSTSGYNLHALALAEKLGKELGVQVIDGEQSFRPLHEDESKNISPHDRPYYPRDYSPIDPENLKAMTAGKRVFIVDDIFTSGGSTKGLAWSLADQGISTTGAIGYMGENRLAVDRLTHDDLVDAIRQSGLNLKAKELEKSFTRQEIRHTISPDLKKVRNENEGAELSRKIKSVVDRRQGTSQDIPGLSDQRPGGYAGNQGNARILDRQSQGQDRGHERPVQDLQAGPGSPGVTEPPAKPTAAGEPPAPGSPSEEIVYFNLGINPGQALKTLSEHLPITPEHKLLFERLYSNPWYMAKTHPEGKPVIDVQLRRDELRNQNYRDFLQKAEPFMTLKGGALKGLEKHVIRWDAAGRDFSRDVKRLQKIGLSDEQIKAYQAIRGVLDYVHDDLRTTLIEAQLVPYRDKPFFKELREAAQNNNFPTDPAILNDPGFKEAFAKLKRPLNKINELRNEIGEIKGYFPRTRDPGNFAVLYRDAEGKQLVARVHTRTEAKAKDLVKQAAKKYPGSKANYEPITKTPESVFQVIDAASLDWFIDKAIKKVKKGAGGDADLVDALQNEVLNALVDELKARGWTKHAVSRTEGTTVKGYKETDLPKVLNQYLAGYAGWKTKYLASFEFSQALKNLNESAPQLFDYWSKYTKDVLRNSETIDQVAGKIRSAAFVWYLLGNMKQFFMQLTQGLTTVLPEFRKLTNFGGSKLSKAGKDIVTKNLSPEEAKMLDVAERKGIIDDHYVQEITARMEGGIGGIYRGAMKVLSLPISGMEKYNRAYTMLAAYRAFREKGQGISQAFKSARDFTQDVHWLYGKANLPEWARGDSAATRAGGRAAYTFVPWGHNYLLFLKNNLNREHWGRAVESLAWMAALAGPLAIPFLDDLVDILEKIVHAPLRKQALESFDKAGKTASRFFKGGLSGLLGLDISGSMKIGIPGSFLWQDKQASSIDNVFGVYTGIGRGLGRGLKLLSDKEYLRAIEEGGPQMVKAPLKAFRGRNEGLTTWKGAPVWDLTKDEPTQDKYSLPEAIGQAAGFNPLRRAEANWRYESYANIKKYAQDRLEELANAYVRAYSKDDQAAMDKVTEEIQAFNDQMEKKGLEEFQIGRRFRVEVRQRLRPAKRQFIFNQPEGAQ
jgi:adenine/guanine phosphoribosyltransferase-like PRPP-binding protein